MLENEDYSDEDKAILKDINLASLGFILIPFGNLLFPFHIWRRYNDSINVDRQGRLILNFQLLWTIGLAISMFASLYIGDILIIGIIPLGALINFIFIAKINYAIENDSDPIIKLPFHI